MKVGIVPEGPHSANGALVVRDANDRVLSVGDGAWARWLEQPENTTFHVECGEAGFTARRELRRGHPYWYAYRRLSGRLRKAYLGRAPDLTPERLAAVSVRLTLADNAAPAESGAAARALAPAAERRHNLPAELSSFLGRHAELAELRRVLSSTRLLTLTGAGGVGKTRLALRLAGGLIEDAAPSVWLVEFATLADPALVPQMVAHALGIPDQPRRSVLETLVTALAPGYTLLLLDNCEHLLDACAHLAEQILRACPTLRILATSREPLGVPGEVAWRVPSLDLPETTSPESLRRSAAVELFLQRAAAARSDVTLTDEHAAVVVEICRRLDGIPLAIELAAARVRTLSPADLAVRLDDRFRLLVGGSRTAPPRQQTLRAAVEWSYDLLTEAGRRLFARLSVFAGGFTLEAAEAIASPESRVRSPGSSPDERPLAPGLSTLDSLARLVDQSLVIAEEPDGMVRYRLLETLRAYAAERLAEHGEAEQVRERHAVWLADRAQHAERSFKGPEQGRWLRWAEREHDNVRAALAWAIAREETELAVRLAAALSWPWLLHQRWREGLDWALRVLSLPNAEPCRERGVLLIGAIKLALFLRDLTSRRPSAEPAVVNRWVEECLAIGEALGDDELLLAAYAHAALLREFGGDSVGMPEVTPEELLTRARSIGDVWGERRILDDLALQAMRAGNLAAAAERLAEAEAVARRAGDTFSLAMVLNNLGDVERARGAHPRAGALYEESQTLFGELGLASPPGMAHNLGYVALAARDRARASACFAQSLRQFRRLGDQRGMAECLIGLGAVAAAEGRVATAGRRFGAGEVALDALGTQLWISNHADYARWLAVARSGRGKRAFDRGRAEGRTLSLDQAIAGILEGEADGRRRKDEPQRSHGPSSQPGGLTLRERDVARLAAQGLTNRQIAVTLAITEKTVANHLQRVFDKLDLRSRTQLAASAIALRIVPTG